MRVRRLGDLPYSGFYREDAGVYNPPPGGVYPPPESYGGPPSVNPGGVLPGPGAGAGTGGNEPVPVTFAPENQANRISVATISVSIARLNGSTQIIPLNYRRKILVVQNNDLVSSGGAGDTLLLAFGNNATQASSVRIPPGGSAFFDYVCPNNSVFLGMVAGTMIIPPTVLEGTLVPENQVPYLT
jgi:hypothetical protein